MRICFDKGRVFLESTDPRADGFFVDWLDKSSIYRLKYGSGQQALARAVGAKPDLNVVDATAGFGRDALVLASFGCQVSLIEASERVYALLEDGWRRALDNDALADVVARMRLYHGDSCAVLRQLSSAQAIDVVYLDPMYPERKKQAAVKKPSYVLQQIAQYSEVIDMEKLLQTALRVARLRVVVKRPAWAQLLSNMVKPVGEIKMVNTRFDIYHPL